MTDKTSASQSNKKLKLYVGVAALIAFATYIQMAVWANFPEVTGPPIPYNHLSSEKTEPYLISEKSPNLSVDRRAAKNWPDVRSCLVRSERQKDKPDLRKFNWGKMRKDADIRVCLFRISASLGTPEKTKQWLESVGLTSSLYIRTDGSDAGKIVVTGSKRLMGYNDITKWSHTYVPSTGISGWITGFIGQAEVFSVRWDKDGKIIQTGHYINTF